MAWNQGGYQGGQRGGYQGGNQGGGYQGRQGNWQTMPNSGVLFPRQKRNPNAADMGGSITLSADLLDYILNAARRSNDPEVKIEVSAWRRSSRDNVNYLSLKAQVPYEIRQQDPAFQQNQSYRPRQNFNPNRRDNGSPDERAQYGPRQDNRQDNYNPPAPVDQRRNAYAEASGRNGRGPSGQPQDSGRRQSSYDDFKAGDRLPDFMRDDDDPNAPPF